MKCRAYAAVLSGVAIALISTAYPARSRAFTTRVHIVLSNEVIDSLAASGDGTIRLRWSTYSVQIPQRDADAIVQNPAYFRAGAIGPDNTVFPAMTDGTHAVHQDPYRQCEMLYQAAFTQAERAYALGCFLHGATDAIAHHFVNYFTGETFTLNPISASRGSSFDNAIGHIVTESIIQGAVFANDPNAFSSSQLMHTIPQDFVLRSYFSANSAIWQRLAEHPLERWRAAQAATPPGASGTPPWEGANLATWIADADFGPWEHVAMAPQYIEELQTLRVRLRAYMEARLAELATQISANPGPDGEFGTTDDTTDCTATCGPEYGEFYVIGHLLASRRDASGNPLPSAFDLISDELGADLDRFLPAFVQVIANLSAMLNVGIADGNDHGLDIDRAQLTNLFQPLDDWATQTFTINWQAAGDAVSPQWYDDLTNFLAGFDINLGLADLLRMLIEPIVDQVRDALFDQVRMVAETFVDDLKQQYDAALADWRTSVQDRLAGSEPDALGGNALDFAEDSGLLVYSFNFTAATLANHEVLLVASDPIGTGPASFDASYTPEWTQLGLCDYLRTAVFPHGLGLVPLLSVELDGTYYSASLVDNSPIECHEGSLSEFGVPGPVTCAHTELDALLLDPYGSLTRAYPPNYASGEPTCMNLRVPGLPDPPVLPGTDGGVAGDGGVAADGGPGSGDGGCGCSTVGSSEPRGVVYFGLAGMLVALVWARRRRRSTRAALFFSVITLASCEGNQGVDAGNADGGRRDGSTTNIDAFMPTDAGIDSNFDAGPDFNDFLAMLDGTVWSGTATRIEGGVEVERAYEMHFAGSGEPLWGEIRNPYGPARRRIRRYVRIAAEGCTDSFRCTIDTTITIPDNTWETPANLRGRAEKWTIEVIDGVERAITITNEATGAAETYYERPWQAPTTGLTAEVRLFEGGSGNPISDAFCTSGGSQDRAAMWEFARGLSAEPTLGRDVVAGAELSSWIDVNNLFGIRDVQGFGTATLGGSERTEQSYFVVRYTGIVRHPGGAFRMRETANEFEDALYVFVGADVDGTDDSGCPFGGTCSVPANSLFLETHGFIYPYCDCTDDEGSTSLAAGDIPIENIVVRCMMPFQNDDRNLGVEMALGGGGFLWVKDQPTAPEINATLFPPVL